MNLPKDGTFWIKFSVNNNNNSESLKNTNILIKLLIILYKLILQ